MTREEAVTELNIFKIGAKSELGKNALDMAVKALEQDNECISKQAALEYDFARFVATEIFDENWEYNKDAFAELACRKLAKLGIVRAKDDEWELIEPQKDGE